MSNLRVFLYVRKVVTWRKLSGRGDFPNRGCPDPPPAFVISGTANVGPRERPWLSVNGIAFRHCGAHTHGGDGEGSALAAILKIHSRPRVQGGFSS